MEHRYKKSEEGLKVEIFELRKRNEELERNTRENLKKFQFGQDDQKLRAAEEFDILRRVDDLMASIRRDFRNSLLKLHGDTFNESSP